MCIVCGTSKRKHYIVLLVVTILTVIAVSQMQHQMQHAHRNSAAETPTVHVIALSHGEKHVVKINVHAILKIGNMTIVTDDDPIGIVFVDIMLGRETPMFGDCPVGLCVHVADSNAMEYVGPVTAEADPASGSITFCGNGTINFNGTIDFIVMANNGIVIAAQPINVTVGPNTSIQYCVYVTLPEQIDPYVYITLLARMFIFLLQPPLNITISKPVYNVYAAYNGISSYSRTYPVVIRNDCENGAFLVQHVTVVGSPTGFASYSIGYTRSLYVYAWISYTFYSICHTYVMIPYIATGEAEIVGEIGNYTLFDYNLYFSNTTRAGTIVIDFGRVISLFSGRIS